MLRWVLLLALLGCDPAPTFAYITHSPSSLPPVRTIPVAIDNAFTPPEVEQLKQSIQDWNVALNGQMSLFVYTTDFNMQDNMIAYITNAHGILMLKVSKYGSVMYSLEDNTDAITSGIGDASREIYFLREKINVQTLKGVALHEIGHCLGAYHRPYGLMKHENDPVAHSCIDWETVRQVAEYNHLNPETMNWCERRN